MDNNNIIDKILELELKMFLSVNTLQKSSCQDDPDSFKRIRKAQFQSWSEKTLKSYLNDLEDAEKQKINLMNYKYGQMDNLIPPINNNPLIDKIVDIQYQWQIRMFNKYPNLMRGARPVSSDDDAEYKTSFETYLKGELTTYSDTTLEYLYKDILEMQIKNHNMSEIIYQRMVMELGYDSLDDAELHAKNR